MDDAEEEPLQLSEEAFRALREFHAEQEKTPDDAEGLPISENWQLSQFWYDESTSKFLAEEVRKSSQNGDWIACLSCPSLYKSLVEVIGRHTEEDKNLTVFLFEYDERFLSLAGDKFVQYDFNHPEAIPETLLRKFQYIAADPPFLSQDCFSKTAELCTKLGTSSTTKILFCTGEIMEENAKHTLGLNRTSFNPRHKSKLSNTFASFTNYPPAVLNDHVQNE
ncbi:hypothetical protein RvY_05601 [Ramazzottius varieornatus]|uniref:Protein-lysine N-methyltransferase RvY_05601 n=1 Tax=Ramazzottius varieornatus TaxID=947166 RepID=A0A1D1UZ76_RAMVA|nr:hypothetical protein RvY_05601 [Ramazzottius varieornatus]